MATREDLSIRVKAGNLGSWLLIRLEKHQFLNFVDNTSKELANSGMNVPGFTLLDGRSGWSFDRESGEAVVFAKAKVFSLYEPTKEKLPYVCLVLVKPIELPKKVEQRNKNLVGTATRRLEITQLERRVTLMGELFVQPTSRAYVPAILAKMPSGETVHILLGAQSLMEPLERERLSRGSLDGLRISIKKSGPEKFSKYIVSSEVND